MNPVTDTADSNESPLLLIVDDDQAYCSALAKAMGRRGFQTIAGHDPESALALATQHEPEYVVLDLNLEGKSGLNLIEPLLECSPGARIVVLTGYASIPTAVGAIKLGALEYLIKPVEAGDIVKALTAEHWEIPPIATDERMTVQRVEWEYIQRILRENGGNITATARSLKMHRRTLQRKLAKHAPTA